MSKEEMKKLINTLVHLEALDMQNVEIPIAAIIGILPPDEYIKLEDLAKELNMMIAAARESGKF